MKYADRADAGRQLAPHLMLMAEMYSDVLVLALPRGGVPVAYEVAAALHAPLDIFLVRKLGAPGHEELAMGAIAEGGHRVMNQHVVNRMRIPQEWVEEVARREEAELERRARLYRGGLMPARITGSTVILVDDGLATGASMIVAVKAAREFSPHRIIVAVPVAPPETCDYLEQYADEVVCPHQPPDFAAVGMWYEDFTQTTDEEVKHLLAEHRRIGQLRNGEQAG